MAPPALPAAHLALCLGALSATAQQAQAAPPCAALVPANCEPGKPCGGADVGACVRGACVRRVEYAGADCSRCAEGTRYEVRNSEWGDAGTRCSRTPTVTALDIPSARGGEPSSIALHHDKAHDGVIGRSAWIGIIAGGAVLAGRACCSAPCAAAGGAPRRRPPRWSSGPCPTRALAERCQAASRCA
jgi:hypothetical protein